MTTQLTQDSIEQLRRYIDGELSNGELDEWLAAAEYDIELSPEERDLLAGIRLVLMEVNEGRRGTPEILGAVAALLASTTPGRPIVTRRSGSDTSWEGEASRTTTGARLQRAGR